MITKHSEIVKGEQIPGVKRFQKSVSPHHNHMTPKSELKKTEILKMEVGDSIIVSRYQEAKSFTAICYKNGFRSSIRKISPRRWQVWKLAKKELEPSYDLGREEDFVPPKKQRLDVGLPVIEKGIPISESTSTKFRHGRYVKLVEQMEIGDSILLDTKSHYQTFNGEMKNQNRKCTSRKQSDGKIRVWRTE